MDCSKPNTAGQRQPHHLAIQSATQRLLVAIERLQDLPHKMSTLVDLDREIREARPEPEAMPLARLLEALPDVLDEYAERIRKATREIDSILF